MNEKEAEKFKEFKKEAEIMMEKDLKKIMKIYRKLPKTEYLVLKELAEISPVKDVLRTVWITAFHAGIKLARIAYEKGKEK